MEKKLRLEVEQLKNSYPNAEIQLWCSDEHRLGLKPVLRRVYVPEGVTPIAQVNWRFQWLWLYAFVHPRTGESYYWILPYVNTQLFSRVLADFAQEFGIGENKQVVLVIDQAGWHTSKELIVPEGLHLVTLPSHSPELQPAERLWSVVDEPIANECFESLDDLEEALYRRCQILLKQPELIKGLTNFYWWQEMAA